MDYLKTKESVINSISRYEDITNQVNLSLSDVACFIGYKLRGLSSIKKNILKQKEEEKIKSDGISELLLNMEKFIENLPKDYEKYFSDDTSFYFKYVSMKESIEFEDFVENEKINIRNHIINFIESNNSINKTDDLYSILISIKTNKNKEIQISERDDYVN